MAESPYETMLQVDVSAAAGYGKHVVRGVLRRRRAPELIHRPLGPRRGDALTARGRQIAVGGGPRQKE